MHKLNPTIALALFVAAIPSLWAVVAPFIGVTVGAATLIVGGFLVASGNDPKNKWRLLFGMWLGIPWGDDGCHLPRFDGLAQVDVVRNVVRTWWPGSLDFINARYS